MPSWSKKSDGWYSNVYRIECPVPHRWTVIDAAAPGPQAVQVDQVSLTAATTFKGRNREAEVLAAATILETVVEPRQVKTSDPYQ